MSESNLATWKLEHDSRNQNRIFGKAIKIIYGRVTSDDNGRLCHG